MKRLKRALSLALSIVMLLSMCVTANATYTPAHTEDADILYELGLFKGMGSDVNGNPVYGLEQKATRIQGIVMLLHLLGEEAEAKEFEGTHPFTDVPAWGDKHVAYAYAKGYTAGTSATTFGSDSPLVGKAYATFVLKALGYDANSDFSYNTALEKAAELGLIQAGDCDGELYRDHCVMLSRNALRTNMKDSDQKLVEKLLDDGVVSEDAVKESCVLNGVVYIPYRTDENGKNKSLYSEDVCAVIPNVACIASKGTGFLPDGIDWKSYEQQRNILINNRYVKDYASGETNSPKKLTLESMFSLSYGNCIVSILDEDYNLIAYYVDDFGTTSENKVPVITCFVDGEQTFKSTRAALKNIRNYTVDSLFYKETVTTINADETESSVKYLRMDEGKLPTELKENAVYYGKVSTDSNGNVDKGELARLQFSYSKYIFNTSMGSNLYTIGETYELGGSKSLDEGNFSMAIYDENRDLIAILNQRQPITANEVHTVIDLREG